MSHEDIEEKLELCYRVFECKLKNTYGIENWSYMKRIDDNKLKNRVKCNLLHEMINTRDHSKNLKIHYYPILHGCANTRKCREKFKNFRIRLVCGCNSTIIMGRLV